MSEERVHLRRADETSIEYVEALLAATGLPTADLATGPERFYVCEADERVGVGGLERHGQWGLLRSIVVEPDARGSGYGTAICEDLEGRAREADVEALFLLTTTAADFFAARGYERIDRGAAPAPIRESPQFAELCPEAATCMRKRV